LVDCNMSRLLKTVLIRIDASGTLEYNEFRGLAALRRDRRRLYRR
jgi:hypothetical protein